MFGYQVEVTGDLVRRRLLLNLMVEAAGSLGQRGAAPAVPACKSGVFR